MILNKWFICFIAIIAPCVIDVKFLEEYLIILKNANNISLIISLLSGLFGFVIALIPLAIQLLSIKNNKFVETLLEKENIDSLIKPLFNRFIGILKSMFILFIFLIVLSSLQTIKIKISCLDIEFFDISVKKYLALILFYSYLILLSDFLLRLKNIIRDLNSLKNIFLKSLKH